mmetsp:Transcript_32384/g.77393  ORF Transcript_32384/g.77393 Transcript_32384/m.77393 type:complete len:207 (+) Transcript_32384:791-1411(+)
MSDGSPKGGRTLCTTTPTRRHSSETTSDPSTPSCTSRSCQTSTTRGRGGERGPICSCMPTCTNEGDCGSTPMRSSASTRTDFSAGRGRCTPSGQTRCQGRSRALRRRRSWPCPRDTASCSILPSGSSPPGKVATAASSSTPARRSSTRSGTSRAPRARLRTSTQMCATSGRTASSTRFATTAPRRRCRRANVPEAIPTQEAAHAAS